MVDLCADEKILTTLNFTAETISQSFNEELTVYSFKSFSSPDIRTFLGFKKTIGDLLVS